MSETIEQAKESIAEAHHAHGDTSARRIAILIAVLAAALALADMGEKGAQNAYLTHHIAVTDDWAFYQAMTDFFVKSPFLMAQRGLANMKKKRWGRIINITSEVYHRSVGNFSA